MYTLVNDVACSNVDVQLCYCYILDLGTVDLPKVQKSIGSTRNMVSCTTPCICNVRFLSCKNVNLNFGMEPCWDTHFWHWLNLSGAWAFSLKWNLNPYEYIVGFWGGLVGWNKWKFSYQCCSISNARGVRIDQWLLFSDTNINIILYSFVLSTATLAIREGLERRIYFKLLPGK